MKVEGKNAVMEALKAGTTIDRLVVAKGLSDPSSQRIIIEAKSRGVKIFFRDKDVLERESVTKKHQGFLAEITDYKYADFEAMIGKIVESGQSNSMVLLLDGIEDPHNLGSIMRVAECMGVDGMVIPRHRSVSVNETVIKVSAGASQHMQVAKVTNLNDAIGTLKDNGYFVYALETNGQDITKTRFDGKIAMVIGGEGKGVHALTKKLCDTTISIPMYGKLNSLNASVACGIALQVAKSGMGK
ncbi:MAG: 23S rRNA (guanosine(2251)-2'-O)-methyltransferase RlmB [Firmicutes bacterium]|nr:23S rRNA (guanosine(2251)-2'-O)-methyltransferase RlmB [Bacillota bacterium]